MMKGQKAYALSASPFAVRDAAGFWTTLKTTLQRWMELHRQRRLLAKLSDDALKDIGLSRADIHAESQRWFWDDPLQR